MDIPVTPDSGDAAAPLYGWIQFPRVVCDTCPDNPTEMTLRNSKVTITRE